MSFNYKRNNPSKSNNYKKDSRYKLTATCFKNLEDLLVQELEELGATSIVKRNRAVEFEGDLELIYKANIWLRTAIRVLKSIRYFKAFDAEELYDKAKKIPWEKFLNRDQTFVIDQAVNSKHFKHGQFAALKLKDAIVDRFRSQGIDRPNVDRVQADVKIHLHIDRERVNISIDSSGDPLFKRGYRSENHYAPLNECLAAALVKFSNWKGEKDLLDPMCGSATIAIEAAMIACNIPPNLNRVHFAFENWNNYDQALFSRVLNAAKQEYVPLKIKISASDKDMRSIRMARINIDAANLRKYIEVKHLDFFDAKAEIEKELMIIINPPYDQRLKLGDGLIEFYEQLGSTLKHQYNGSIAWIISSELDALKRIGLKAAKKVQLLNGKLECEFRSYQLFKGKRKEHILAKN